MPPSPASHSLDLTLLFVPSATAHILNTRTLNLCLPHSALFAHALCLFLLLVLQDAVQGHLSYEVIHPSSLLPTKLELSLFQAPMALHTQFCCMTLHIINLTGSCQNRVFPKGEDLSTSSKLCLHRCQRTLFSECT